MHMCVWSLRSWGVTGQCRQCHNALEGVCHHALVCIVSVHCREEGCIGKYTPRGPRDFPRAGTLHPEAREIARGRSPKAISRAEGCKIPALGKSLGPRGVYFPIHPSSRQCTDTMHLSSSVPLKGRGFSTDSQSYMHL